MASGYPLASFLHERCTANGSRTMFTWWCTCPNVVAFIWTVPAFIPPYTCMHLHFSVPMKIPVTSSERCISHSTMIELLTTSSDLQISKGVNALKQLFLRKKKDTVPSNGQRTLQNINLLQLAKTARNFKLRITKFMFLAKILIKYLTAKCSGVISSISMDVKMQQWQFSSSDFT